MALIELLNCEHSLFPSFLLLLFVVLLEKRSVLLNGNKASLESRSRVRNSLSRVIIDLALPSPALFLQLVPPELLTSLSLRQRAYIPESEIIFWHQARRFGCTGLISKKRLAWVLGLEAFWHWLHDFKELELPASQLFQNDFNFLVQFGLWCLWLLEISFRIFEFRHSLHVSLLLSELFWSSLRDSFLVNPGFELIVYLDVIVRDGVATGLTSFRSDKEGIGLILEVFLVEGVEDRVDPDALPTGLRINTSIQIFKNFAKALHFPKAALSCLLPPLVFDEVRLYIAILSLSRNKIFHLCSHSVKRWIALSTFIIHKLRTESACRITSNGKEALFLLGWVLKGGFFHFKHSGVHIRQLLLRRLLSCYRN